MEDGFKMGFKDSFIEEFQRAYPVSYTHLDVYKRQACDKLIPVTLELGGKSANIVFDDADLKQAIDGACKGILFNPVSYTHLDVYKRQRKNRNKNT